MVERPPAAHDDDARPVLSHTAKLILGVAVSILMDGVAPHMCDKLHATPLDWEAGGRPPCFLSVASQQGHFVISPSAIEG
jgi:hypothetical protein